MIHLFHLVLNVLTFFFFGNGTNYEKKISGQEVKKLIASKQKHEWKRKARLLVPSPPLTEATPVTKNLCRIYKYE